MTNFCGLYLLVFGIEIHNKSIFLILTLSLELVANFFTLQVSSAGVDRF